ncbi:MAG: hypothetical protein E6H72_08965 [Betaproteobacteria bacterium]|nr:MAG: hypothetical protein E6H72_08965 [Betaproteobacteria bacterium]
MKPLFRSIAVLTLSAASLSAGAALKPTDLFGEPAQAPSAERAIVTAVADRTITIDDKTRWVNVNHYEVIRFVSNVAPAGFVNHSVTVYVAPSDRDFPG